jgi:Fe2+ or Zn2+ uptake regulation protein
MSTSEPSKIIDELSCRHTKVRFGIISIFHQIKKPISATEIITILKDKFSTSANKTTIYRQLDFLVSKNMISVTDIEGTKYYQLNKNQPHQVLVCRQCHDIIPLKSGISIDNNKLSEIEQKHHFKIDYYSFLCFGSCQKCLK